MSARLRAWAHRLKREVMTLYVLLRHPDTPLWSKAVAAVVVAYALSPIDLIPDAIPVLGLVDDLLLVPLGVALALSLLPRPLIAEARREAAALSERPVSRAGAAMVVSLWLLALLAALWWWRSR